MEFFGKLFSQANSVPERQEPTISKEAIEDIGRALNAESVAELPYEVIHLPEDSELQEFLKNKLTEYRVRLADQRARHPYASPETFTDTNYKIALLEALLEQSDVDPSAVAKNLRMRDQSLDEASFTNAVNVIAHYVEGSAREAQETISPFVSAQSFEELFSMLDEQGSIESDGKVQQVEDIKRAIQFVIEHGGDINSVTRALGLREKVQELLLK